MGVATIVVLSMAERSDLERLARDIDSAKPGTKGADDFGFGVRIEHYRDSRAAWGLAQDCQPLAAALAETFGLGAGAFERPASFGWPMPDHS